MCCVSSKQGEKSERTGKILQSWFHLLSSLLPGAVSSVTAILESLMLIQSEIMTTDIGYSTAPKKSISWFSQLNLELKTHVTVIKFLLFYLFYLRKYCRFFTVSFKAVVLNVLI
jgi:hypothetical protein